MSRPRFVLGTKQGLSGVPDCSFCFLLYSLDSYPSQNKKEGEEIYKDNLRIFFLSRRILEWFRLQKRTTYYKKNVGWFCFLIVMIQQQTAV